MKKTIVAAGLAAAMALVGCSKSNEETAESTQTSGLSADEIASNARPTMTEVPPEEIDVPNEETQTPASEMTDDEKVIAISKITDRILGVSNHTRANQEKTYADLNELGVTPGASVNVVYDFVNDRETQEVLNVLTQEPEIEGADGVYSIHYTVRSVPVVPSINNNDMIGSAEKNIMNPEFSHFERDVIVNVDLNLGTLEIEPYAWWVSFDDIQEEEE